MRRSTRLAIGGCVAKRLPKLARLRNVRQDEQVRVGRRSRQRQLLRVSVELLQRAGQGIRISRDVGPRGVGLVLARAGNGQLDTSVAAMGARIIMMMPVPPMPRPRLSRPPPNMPANRPNWASMVIAPASVAAMELVRMSRFLTCPSSWASTPSSSSSLRRSRMPWVTVRRQRV